MSTTNLNLTTTAFPTDGGKTVEQWILELTGASNSNMTKIDNFAGETDGVIDGIKGAGWTTQTIKGNADAIATLNGRVTYTVSPSGTNTLTATIPQITTPLVNSIIKVIPTANNTGAMTFNVNGEGALPVTKVRTVSGSLVYAPMDANDFRIGSQVLLTKSSDGVRWISLTHGEIFARNIYYDNGNGTFTTAQAKFDEKVSKSGDAMTGALKFVRSAGNIRNYKDVLHWNGEIATGILKITLPYGWSGTLLKGNINGFEYKVNQSWSLEFSGQNLGIPSWLETTAKVNGKCPFTRVRFAYDGSKCCILLGDLATYWVYPALVLTDFIASRVEIDGWETGWSASIITSESGLTNIVEASLQIPANKTQENWIAPTLLNGWVNFGGGTQIAQYMKDEFGFVHIRGVIKNGVASAITQLFILPVGYRPITQNHFCVISNSVSAFILAEPSGAVSIVTGSNTSVSLNISFKGEQ